MLGTRSTDGYPGTACECRYGTTSGVPQHAANACWLAGARCWSRKTSTQWAWKASVSSAIAASVMTPDRSTSSTSAPTAGDSVRTSNAVWSGGVELVVPGGVAGQQLRHEVVAQVVALGHGLDRVGELAVRVRVVGRVHDRLVAELRSDDRNEPLVRFRREEQVAVGEVLRRLLLHLRHLARAALKVLVEPLHPVGRPAAAGLQEAHAQIGEVLHDAAAHDVGE